MRGERDQGKRERHGEEGEARRGGRGTERRERHGEEGVQGKRERRERDGGEGEARRGGRVTKRRETHREEGEAQLHPPSLSSSVTIRSGDKRRGPPR